MKTLCCAIVAVVTLLLFSGELLHARTTVYLKDGAVLQAESARRSDGSVTVLVNRDVELTFAEDEVNLKKTFVRKPVRHKPRHTITRAAAVTRPAVQGSMSSATKKPAASSGVPQVPRKQGLPAPPPKPSSAAPAPSTSTVANASLPATPKQTAPAPAPVPAPGTVPPLEPLPPDPGTVNKIPLPGAGVPITTLQAVPKGMIIGILAAIVVLAIVLIASLWKVYEKAGQAGWKSIIPVYNYVVFLAIIGKPVWWVILLFLPVVSLIILIIMHVELARKFGKGLAYGLGLCFLPFIFFPLLAFGDATYEE